MAEVETEALAALGLEGGAKVDVEPDLPAAKAGVDNGDIVFQVDAEVKDPEGISQDPREKKPGESVVLHVARGTQRLDLPVVLEAAPEAMKVRSPAEALSGEISRMQGPFPKVLHHDTLLKPDAMGGPVCNDQGRCIGMNIARADRTSTYALPTAVVRDLYRDLKGRRDPLSASPVGLGGARR